VRVSGVREAEACDERFSSSTGDGGGRRLAHRQKIRWKESWDFLDHTDMYDLSTPDGLQALENYLRRRTASCASTSSLDGECSSSEQLPLAPPLSPALIRVGNGILDAKPESDILLSDLSKLSLHDMEAVTPKSSTTTVPNQVFLLG